MTNKILVVALAGISAVAMAQSDGQKSTSTPSQASSAKQATPAKPTSAQPAEQRMHKPITVTAEASATPDSATSKVSKTSAADDWEAPKAKTSAPTNGQPRVAPTMMQDGKAASLQTTSSTQSASSSNSATSSASSSDVKSPRDLASGQASGKRMHKPMTVTAEAGATADANAKQAPAPAKK